MAYKLLTQKQRSKLLRELKCENKVQYSDRIKVILLLDDGKLYLDIKKFLFLDEDTIDNYRRQYIEGGLEALLNDDSSVPKSSLNDKKFLDIL